MKKFNHTIATIASIIISLLCLFCGGVIVWAFVVKSIAYIWAGVLSLLGCFWLLAVVQDNMKYHSKSKCSSVFENWKNDKDPSLMEGNQGNLDEV